MAIRTFLFIGTFATLFTSCEGKGSPQHEPPAIGETVSQTDKDIWVIFRDKNHNYWFGSDGQGVYRYSGTKKGAAAEGKSFTHFSTKHGLCNDHIREIKEDKSGNVYFTTLNGVSKFDGTTFTTLTMDKNNDPNAWTLKPGDLWFKGSDGMGGPLRYDGTQLHLLKFPKNELEDDFNKLYPDRRFNPYDIYYIYKDRKGNMWFGTAAMGLYRYDGTSVRNLYEDHLTNTPGGGSFGIRSVFEDKSGEFRICNTAYLYHILPGDSKEKGKGFINYSRGKGIDGISDPLGGDRIYFQSIAEDSRGDIWLQTYNGGIWNYDGKKLTNYPVKDGAKDINVVSMYQDNEGELWLATQGGGVYKYGGKTFEPFRP